MERSTLATTEDDTRDPLGPLAGAAMTGDSGALEELLHALLPRTRNLVRYLIGGDSEVDDIAQTALWAVARGLHAFEGRGPLTSWSDRIVARCTFAAIRARAGRSRASADWELEVVSRSEPSVSDYLRRRWMVRLLDQLPAEQRETVVLHHVMELTVPEVAAEMAVPAETVRSRLRLAKARLRSLGEGADNGHERER
jgi:RNA polymerase sigma-70 factor (ECF subfamily)